MKRVACGYSRKHWSGEKASFWISFKSFEIDWACVYKEKFNEHFNCWHITIKWKAGVDDKKSKEEKWNKNKLNLKDWSEMLESWKGGRFFLCKDSRYKSRIFAAASALVHSKFSFLFFNQHFTTNNSRRFFRELLGLKLKLFYTKLNR